MIKIDGKKYKVGCCEKIENQIVTFIEDIETGESCILIYSKENGYMLWVPKGMILDFWQEVKVPGKVEINISGENKNGVLNVAGKESRFVPYKVRQFFN